MAEHQGRGGALLRPMLPAPAPDGLDLAGTRVLLLGGEVDAMIPPDRVEALADALRAAGADVQERWAATGHGLTQGDLDAAAAFVRTFPTR